jgi:hypothetical protein
MLFPDSAAIHYNLTNYAAAEFWHDKCLYYQACSITPSEPQGLSLR